MARSTPTANVTASEARRVLLSLQQLSRPPRASSAKSVGRLVETLGYVQIDSINVFERAHHLILATRLTGYRASHLAQNLERSRTLFEHWTHDACAIPSRWYPHWKRRFERYGARVVHNRWWQGRFQGDPARVLAKTLARVRAEGPLRARDFLAEPRGGGQGWWEWHPEKAALEHLWRSGVLAIARREGFQKVYDLVERVFPNLHEAPQSDEAAHDDWACSTAIERLGIATEREIAAFFAATEPAKAKRWCAAKVDAGELVRVHVENAAGGAPTACVALPEWRRHARAPNDTAMIALCPFDPVVRDRDRLERLFGFQYRFEAFVPAAKRTYGYYVLPLLEGDRFVGRIDPKFDRERDTIIVRGPWWEPGVKPDRARRQRLDAALERLAGIVGAARWSFAGTGPTA